MNKQAVSHRPYSEQAYGLDEGRVALRFKCAKGEVKSAAVFYRDRFEFGGERELESAPMAFLYADALFGHFEAVIDGAPDRLAYYFSMESDKTYYLTSEGLSLKPPKEAEFEKFFELHYNHRADLPKTALWLQKAVIYQIFPDSFADGKRAISAKQRQLPRADGGVSHAERGGTLRGIIENLDYIGDLGFTCLYLNPIFAANTPHRYDTADYMDIDPLLGAKADLRELVEKAHALNMKVILDGVFNHSGAWFFAFRDVIKNGAASAYKDWFYRIDGYPVALGNIDDSAVSFLSEGDVVTLVPAAEKPVKPTKPTKPNYATFAYTGHMPKLNLANEDAKKYFIDVITYWVKEFDIDGWRLDVADEVNAGFWREARAAMLAVKPDTVLIGEIWGDARRWLDGDMFDSLMNYGVMRAMERFCGGETDAEELADMTGALLTRYKKPYQYAQMNLLDSHDTPRFLGKMKGDIKKYKLALIYQMFHIGAPSIYYGDELGLSDTEPRLWRQTMPWALADTSELLLFVKGIIAIRDKHMDAVLGQYIQRYAKGRVYAFERLGGKSRLLVILNAGDKPAKVDIEGEGAVELEAWEGKVVSKHE